MKEEIVKKVVRESYAQIAQAGSPCCLPATACCGGVDMAAEISKKIGYADKDLKSVPEGANLGLGCGNPLALASLKEGETVLDLGAGAGFDCFLAANQVGKTGKVIGVDMTPEMVQKARENAGKGGYGNVEFRLGEIENLPVADQVVDAVISNCVINLAPDKGKVLMAIVLGQRAYDLAIGSSLPAAIKKMLSEARPYAEGRGIRFSVSSPSGITTVKKLMEIKTTPK